MAAGFLKILRHVFVGAAWLAVVTGFHVIAGWPWPFSVLAGVLFPLIVLRRRGKRFFALCALGGFSALLIAVALIRPSNQREWAAEFAVLPRIVTAQDRVTVEGFRAFRWRGLQDFDRAWESRDFDLRELSGLDLIIEPFKGSGLMAHTMLRFRFGEDASLVVSVEARREIHERYSLVAGALRQFELIYIFGDERDLLELRAVHRGARLYAYPVKADPEFVRGLFLDLAEAANGLHSSPRFYRSLRDNCTTTLVKHVDRRHVERIGLRYETVFPVLTGRLLYRKGFMDTDLPYEEAREAFRVDDKIRALASGENPVR